MKGETLGRYGVWVKMVYFDFISCFFSFLFFKIWFLWGEAPGERGRERHSNRQEKERKQSFPFAHRPSYKTCTTSTRPVFDNLYY